jgi:putative nucleotidyltransferase with HDIG domain
MDQQESFFEIIDQPLTSGNGRLPVFNATALRIQQEIAKEEPDINLVERLVVSDQSLTAKVLSVSNSPFYKGLHQVATVRNAIVRLGINEVSNIVMAVTHENNFRSKDPFVHSNMRALWRHSLGCARGSNWLAKKCGLNSLAHEAFFAGLLHDVGKLRILTFIDDLKCSDDLDIQPSDALLRKVMERLHTNQGYSLMVHWNLPEKYCHIVRDHHHKEFDPNDVLQILVRLADKACLRMGIGTIHDPGLDLAETAEAELLQISGEDLAHLEIMLLDSKIMAGG